MLILPANVVLWHAKTLAHKEQKHVVECSSEVLAQFEVRRPASRIHRHTARRTAMLLSCGQSLDPQADVDLDSPAASHVAILPSVSHLTSGQLLRRAANDKVRSAQTWREERLAKAPLPAAAGLPQTFGWTQEERYEAAVLEMEMQRLFSLSAEDQVRCSGSRGKGKYEARESLLVQSHPPPPLHLPNRLS